MRQRAQREGIFVQVLGFAQEILNEVSAANVMGQIAEERVPKRIVTHVLNDGAAIGIRVRLPEVFLG